MLGLFFFFLGLLEVATKIVKFSIPYSNHPIQRPLTFSLSLEFTKCNIEQHQSMELKAENENKIALPTVLLQAQYILSIAGHKNFRDKNC